jgi:NAD(P)-dependent dehydrogenase (short-subunit alcohol dehydrogenase family)
MPTALVTGASRGVGRGAAIALSDAGFTVYATGRTIAGAALPSSIVRIACDHRDDGQTAAAFARIAAAAGGLDVLVNAAWGGYERMVDTGGRFTWTLPFWEQPLERWTLMLDSGVRAAYVCSAAAARAMLPAKRGLIVNISFWAAQKFVGNAIYGISKAATDKLTRDTAHELRTHGITVVSLYPGLVRTESVLAAASQGWLDLSNSESPEFTGRVVAALWRDPGLHERSGQVLIGAAVAGELNVVDSDGRKPPPLSLEQV